MRKERFVVHLPVSATDLPAAKRLARAITRALGFLPDVDPGEMTVSEEDAQFVRHRVFCDTRLDGGRRCRRLADHDGPCTAAVSR
ncbi:hypothetical protein [Micromonospora avicenniae]|uniref:Uncharacterized protein n=1 Tax=Micromonospora avicenniae TaxID=1198245 RepID=A0A1N6QFN7_9ACTN|nr:hypothetical protein [Micromonospora avicenniae]SIQ15350.1 hypothetical protein SAMN05444858_101314 [Micromonospora avicenniae]